LPITLFNGKMHRGTYVMGQCAEIQCTIMNLTMTPRSLPQDTMPNCNMTQKSIAQCAVEDRIELGDCGRWCEDVVFARALLNQATVLSNYITC
jgi:hypothetical protein